MSNGKGSRRRDAQVDPATAARNWQRTFGHAKDCRCIMCWHAMRERELDKGCVPEDEYDGYSQIPGVWPQDTGKKRDG